MGESFGPTKHVLVVKNALTHYCELFPCASATAHAAGESLFEWYMRYGRPETLTSDQGWHFCNETVTTLCVCPKVHQEFTLVYSPWVNGTVKRLNRDILEVIRALLVEYKLATTQWPYLLPVVEANLNHTAVSPVANHAPIELFFGLNPQSALDCVVMPKGNGAAVEIADGEDQSSLSQLRSSLHGLHQQLVRVMERKQLAAMVKAREAVRKIDLGDYVLWPRIDKHLGSNKLLGQWLEPFTVVEARSNSFVIKHLVSGTLHEVHGLRLKFYAESSFETAEEIVKFISNQGILLGVERFANHRFHRVAR